MSATTTVISSKITPGFLAKSVLPQPILWRAQFSDYTTDKALSAYLQQMEGDVLNEVKDLLNIYYGDVTHDLGAHRKFSEAKQHFEQIDPDCFKGYNKNFALLGLEGKGGNFRSKRVYCSRCLNISKCHTYNAAYIGKLSSFVIKPSPTHASSTHHGYRCHADGYLEYKWILQELVFHPH